MNRITLIQQIIRAANFKTYLEIGSQSGKSLLPIKCKYKIAVDPIFRIPLEKKLKWLIKNPSNIRTTYFEETSDDFFNKRKSLLAKKAGIDIILIDGLHTFEASLKDVLNSLACLNPEGIIIMHDCYPPTIASATPAKSKQEASVGLHEEWCGDVWKTIVYLRKVFSDKLEAYVIDADFGLGIVRIKDELGFPLQIENAVFDSINIMQFEDILQNPKQMLGLKDIGVVDSLIKEFASSDL